MFFLARTVGFEPTPQGFGDPHATITTRPYIKDLVHREGLEPPVFTLEGCCISRYATGAFGWKPRFCPVSCGATNRRASITPVTT